MRTHYGKMKSIFAKLDNQLGANKAAMAKKKHDKENAKRRRINNMDTMTKMALRKMLSEGLDTEEPKDTSLDDMIKEYINKYKPTVYMVCKEMLEIMKDFVKNDDYYKVVAENKRNMYDAYVKTGFSEDQAMALILNDNLQLMKSIQNAKTTNSKNK